MTPEIRQGNDVTAEYLEECLSGERLYGDEFDEVGLREWFEDESGAYQALGSESTESSGDGTYPYHALNSYHGFGHLDKRGFEHVLCLGGGDAEEVIHADIRAERITVVEPVVSPSSSAADRRLPRVNHVKALASGDIDLADESVDLITCFGTLHHIANVTYVLREMARCLRPGGVALIREPVVSMGDWSKPRKGLTTRERGIPDKLLRRGIEGAGFELQRAAPCMFAPILRIERVVGRSLISRRSVVVVDSIMSRLSRWNLHYRSKNTLGKISPTNMAVVARKPR